MNKDFKDRMGEDIELRCKMQLLKPIEFVSNEVLLEKQIEEYETFLKYLGYYIDEINLRLKRIRVMYEKEKKKNNK